MCWCAVKKLLTHPLTSNYCRRNRGELNFLTTECPDGGGGRGRLQGPCLKPAGCTSIPTIFLEHNNEWNKQIFIKNIKQL